MRGAGTLRSIVGRPIFGKKKQQDEPEDLGHDPPKKQKRKLTGPTTSAGQKSILSFYQVAARRAHASTGQLGVASSGTTPEADATRRAASAPPEPDCSSGWCSDGSDSGSGAAADGMGDDDVDSSSQPEPSKALQHIEQQSPEACCGPGLQLCGPLLVSTRVVGRQHQAAGWPPAPGCRLQLVREAHNPVDPCAILVCSVNDAGQQRAHGHLPAAVAAHLAPLMDGSRVVVQAQLAAAVAAAVAAAAPGPAAGAAALLTSRRSSTPQLQPSPGSQGSGDLLQHTAADAPDDSAQQQQQQQQQLLHLHVTVTCEADPHAAAAALTAIDRAASAGLDSLQPGRSSGALLTAAFEHILQQTQAHDLHLLSQQEQVVLQHMQALPAAAKVLLLRLLLRKRTWFQLSTLAYADVLRPEAAASRLSAVGLLHWDSHPAADLDSLLQELPVVVLKQVLAALLPRGHPAVQGAAAAAAAGGGGGGLGSSGPNKAAVIHSIKANASRARLQAAITAAAGPCVSVSPAAVDTFARLQLMYFASPGHDLSMFVAVERGAVSYPRYDIQRTRPVFSSRQQLLEYQDALGLAARVDTALEEGDNDGAWQLLQPALSALHAGVHKAITWDDTAAPVPNPPPRQRSAPPQEITTSSAHTQVDTPAGSPALKDVPSATAAQRSQEFTAAAAAAQQQPAQEHGLTAATAAGAAINNNNKPGSCGVPPHAHSCTPGAAASPQVLQPPAEAAGGLCGRSGRGGGGGCVQGASSAPKAPELCGASQATSSDVSWDTLQGAEDDGDEATTTPDDDAAAAALQAADCCVQPALDHLHHSSQQQRPGPTPTALLHTAAAQNPQSTAAAAVMAVGAAAEGPGPPLFFARFCAGWVFASLGTVAVSLLEKQKRWGEAVDLLRLLLGGNACVGRRGDWWTRLAINLEHLHRTEDALEAVEAALADSWVRGGDLLGLQRRYLRLGKPPRRWKRPAWATQAGWEPPEVVITVRPLNNNTGTKSRFYAPDNSLVTVEQLALQHYASEEAGAWQGLHCEGGVWAALFTLLLWDVIFTGLPDVFRCPFQTAPLDLDTDAFYPTRRHQLDAQLARIADGQAGIILTAVWTANAGVMARGVNWQRFGQQQLVDICDCVGGLGLAAVLRLMAEDHAGAAGGLPDLLLWRTCDKSAKLVEVKGPRDRLSDQQRFWLAHMDNNTMQVEVLKVKEPNAGKRK